jgi:hypothetical protein
MTTYLSGGWYRPGTGRRLRTEVIDGAMDAAGMLHRAGISPERISVLALKVRSLMTLADPQMMGDAQLTDRDRERMLLQIEDCTGYTPALLAWVCDCIEHVEEPADLTAFYLHLVHVARMLHLLAQAGMKLGPKSPSRRRVTTARKAKTAAAAPLARSRRKPKAGKAKRSTKGTRTVRPHSKSRPGTGRAPRTR